MAAISKVIEFLGWLQEALYKAYREIYDLGPPFWYFAWPFYLAADAVNRLGWAFYDFYFWVGEIQDRIQFVMTPSEYIGWIYSFWPLLSQIHDWFRDRINKIKEVVNEWWTATSSTVLDWIDTAKAWAKIWIDWLDNRVSQLEVRLDNLVIEFPDVTELLAWFSNWPGNVWSIIDNWWISTMGEIQGLISSAFKEREPFWAGWQDFRDRVAEFFTDPVEFVWARFTDWFLGPEV